MDKIDIYVYYDYDKKRYISYVKLLSDKYMIYENEDIFLCLSNIWKYLNYICYNSRILINKSSTYINILDRKHKSSEIMNFKYREIYDKIF